MSNTTSKHCEFCGETLKPIYFKGLLIALEDCSCAEAVAYRKEKETEEDKVRKETERKLFYANLKSAGIRKRYFDAKDPAAKDYVKRVDAGQSFYLTGSYGVGKTYLASAIARQLIYHGKRVKFATSIDLLIEIQSTYGRSEAERDVIAKYSRCDALFLDDFGKEPPTDWALSRLYTIINNRDVDMHPIVVTSNYKISEITTRFAGCDASTAEAIASRLAGMCEVITMNGEDRRLQ